MPPKKKNKTLTITLAVLLEVTEPRSFPGLYEDAATVKAADGEYRIGRCIAGTALHIFRPNGRSRLVIPMAALLRSVMDEIFRLERARMI